MINLTAVLAPRQTAGLLTAVATAKRVSGKYHEPSLCARILIVAIVANTFLWVLPSIKSAQAQRPIVVTADQPNIWTLEQAHYLLAQMHRRNLDLKAASLEALDANAINGLSVDALKTLLSVSAEFDQAIGVNNKLLKDDKAYNANRKRELLTRRAKLEDESLALTRQIAELKIKLLRAKTDEEKKEIQSEIDELTIVRDTVKEQVAQTNEQLKALPSISDKFDSVDVDAGTTSASNTYDSVFQETAKKVVNEFNNAPKLNASLRLDNYLQMQYEILSKQLTLLRDEVGPGERLIFMEMPQSINASHGKANQKWAQSWWKIAGYSECVILTENGKTVPCSKVLPSLDRTEVQNRTSTSEIAEKVRQFNPSVEFTNFKKSLELTTEDLRDDFVIESNFAVQQTEFGEKLSAHFSPTSRGVIENYRSTGKMSIAGNQRQLFRADIVKVLNRFITNQILQDHKFDSRNSFRMNNPLVKLQGVLPPNSQIFRRLYLEKEFSWVKPLEKFAQDIIDLDRSGKSGTVWGDAENRSIRVVDLFPRQSSLNVNDLKLRSNTFSFKFVLQLLSGIGGDMNYQRQREQYSQFVQQELYSSAFGKGSREFGWTFNPMPGTTRLLSGVRTTYAIVVVPEDTTSIIVQSKGCYFPRSSSQPASFTDDGWNSNELESRSGCTPPRKFIIPIPDGGSMNSNNFTVSEIRYRPEIKKGERTVVTIQGRNFSSQIGVLVNGVPLTQSLGLGQPFIRDDSTTGREAKTEFSTAKVKGTFERIGANQIVAAFEMDKDFEGVPIITLVAPGEAVDLNSLDNIKVNDTYIYKYGFGLKEWPFMFGTKVGTKENEVIIDKTNVFQVNEKLNVVITGKNLNRVKRVYINGRGIDNPTSDLTLPAIATPTPGVPSAPSPTPDPHADKRYLIVLTDLPPLPSEKAIQVTLLTADGAINPPPVENPGFKKDTPQQTEKYQFDETKFLITAAPTLARCEETGGKIEQATFEVQGKGFTENTKAFLVLDKVEQEQEFVFENTARGTLKVKNPGYELKIVLKDGDSKLKTQKVITWKKPTTGC